MTSYVFSRFLLACFLLANLLLRINVVPFFILPIVFQDLQTEMRIGSGREREGLYYLDDSTLHSGLAALSSFDTP